MKKLVMIFSLLFFMITALKSQAAYVAVGDFAIGETFMDAQVNYGAGVSSKVALVFRGMTPTTLLIFISTSPETTYLLAPGYCIVDKTQNSTYWYFDFGLGVARDVTFRIQKISNNKIRVWRE